MTRTELAMDGEVPIRPPWPRFRWAGGHVPVAGPVYCPPAIDDLMAAIATYKMLDEQRAGAIREVIRQTIA
jgi:hypothetical protein